MARPERFELPTYGFVDHRSIQLGYGRAGLETNKLKHEKYSTANRAPRHTEVARTQPWRNVAVMPQRHSDDSSRSSRSKRAPGLHCRLPLHRNSGLRKRLGSIYILGEALPAKSGSLVRRRYSQARASSRERSKTVRVRVTQIFT